MECLVVEHRVLTLEGSCWNCIYSTDGREYYNCVCHDSLPNLVPPWLRIQPQLVKVWCLVVFLLGLVDNGTSWQPFFKKSQ